MFKLYTIGYATKKVSEFVDLLKKYNITSVVDVRSNAHSKMFPEYNSDNIKKILKTNNIFYGNLSKEFGARRTEEEVYSKRIDLKFKDILQVDFMKVYDTTDFKEGTNRILNGLKKNVICLMCSEKYPYDCHRTLMVAEWFHKQGLEVINIIDQENILTQEELHKLIIEDCYNLKKKFYKKHDIKSEFCSPLVSVNCMDKHIETWFNFFESIKKENELEKALILKNIEIGYIRGEEENE